MYSFIVIINYLFHCFINFIIQGLSVSLPSDVLLASLSQREKNAAAELPDS